MQKKLHIIYLYVDCVGFDVHQCALARGNRIRYCAISKVTHFSRKRYVRIYLCVFNERYNRVSIKIALSLRGLVSSLEAWGRGVDEIKRGFGIGDIKERYAKAYLSRSSFVLSLICRR